jgi:hypothetical protein
MTTFQVFDPAQCCATGVCGVDVDEALVRFAADLDWLKSKGVAVERNNLAQQPLAFAGHSTIRQLLQEQGDKSLPAILVDGKLKSSGRYPSRAELARWAGLTAPTPGARTGLGAITIVATEAGEAPGGCCASPASGPSKCC